MRDSIPNIRFMLILYIRKVVMNLSKSCFVWSVSRLVGNHQQFGLIWRMFGTLAMVKLARICNNKRMMGKHWVEWPCVGNFHFIWQHSSVYFICYNQTVFAQEHKISLSLPQFMLKAIKCTVIMANTLLPHICASSNRYNTGDLFSTLHFRLFYLY